MMPHPIIKINDINPILTDREKQIDGNLKK